MVRTYSELVALPTFVERFEYLNLVNEIGTPTFGGHRWLNQAFYRSIEWKYVRDLAIVRDCGCDLGMEGYGIIGRVLVHHMNPLSVEDLQRNPSLGLDLETLITVSHDTHNAIHYGTKIPRNELVTRHPNDTCLWKG